MLEKNEAIATITMNRPSALNAMNNELRDGLRKALLNVQEDESIRVVVLTGNGRAFCAGGDLWDIKDLNNIAVTHHLMAIIEGVTSLIMDMEKPVTAMVNGVAAGIGFNLALACAHNERSIL